MHEFLTRLALPLTPAHCEEPDPAEADFLDIDADDMPDVSPSDVPSFKELTFPLKSALMDMQGMSLSGFSFVLGLPLSPFFLLSQEIHMSPKRGRNDNMMADMMQGGRMPFYTLSAQYASVNEKLQHKYTMLARIDSQAQIQTVFMKPIGKKGNLRLVGGFPNANPQFANLIAEADFRQKDTKYSFFVNVVSAEMSIMQRITSRFLIGTQISYDFVSRSFSNSFAMRLTKNPTNNFYLSILDGQSILNLGYLTKIDAKTSIATEFDISAENLESSVGLGYRRKNALFDVHSSVRTSGEIKTLVGYKANPWLKMKLFLSGNLFNDDFKTGYSLSLMSQE